MPQSKLYLASRSPRRRELLGQIGIDYTLIDVDIAEVVGADETALDYVQRVAREKAEAGWQALNSSASSVVLAADTEVVLAGHVFGKPAGRADAGAMLRQLSNQTHEVLSAVVVRDAHASRSALSISRVRIAPLSDTMIEKYLDSQEWCGKAGAYAIQGRAAAFIDRIEGSHSGIMGLPLFETAALLRHFGF